MTRSSGNASHRGLKLKSTYNNYYYVSPEIQAQSDEALSFESGLHETQATSDILPTPG